MAEYSACCPRRQRGVTGLSDNKSGNTVAGRQQHVARLLLLPRCDRVAGNTTSPCCRIELSNCCLSVTGPLLLSRTCLQAKIDKQRTVQETNYTSFQLPSERSQSYVWPEPITRRQ
uniref:Uncharacterized protein n=1 Tax=Ixodes ricinus TaxID=34613 RepID=A0A6B0UL81_IXORI